MSRWLVTGAGGMLDTDLVAALEQHEIAALSRAELDVTAAQAVHDVIAEFRPHVVANCAAWTAVDAAEEQEGAAFEVNAIGAANVASACSRWNAAMLQFSTDYVFDGSATTPYQEDSPLRPISAYGRTKAAGEWAVRALLPENSWIVRTAWLYGAAGPNFVQTMIRLESTKDTVDVVDDQRGQPTWTADLARQAVHMAQAGAPPGTYHGTATDQTSWYGLARAVFNELGANPDRVRPTTSDRFPRPARRPAFSVLGHVAWRRAGLSPLPPWRESLAHAFDTLRKTA